MKWRLLVVSVASLFRSDRSLFRDSPGPQRLGLVQLLVLGSGFLDLLGLFRLVLVLYLLDLGSLVLALLDLLRVVLDLLLDLLGDDELDRVGDELGLCDTEETAAESVPSIIALVCKDL